MSISIGKQGEMTAAVIKMVVPVEYRFEAPDILGYMKTAYDAISDRFLRHINEALMDVYGVEISDLSASFRKPIITAVERKTNADPMPVLPSDYPMIRFAYVSNYVAEDVSPGSEGINFSDAVITKGFQKAAATAKLSGSFIKPDEMRVDLKSNVISGTDDGQIGYTGMLTTMISRKSGGAEILAGQEMNVYCWWNRPVTKEVRQAWMQEMKKVTK